MTGKWFNDALFAVILCVYLAGQLLIGTYHPEDRRFVFDAPSDVDFLYYGAIANTLLNTFPPENPSFAKVKLTQPYVQFVPAALLAKVLDPFSAFRILNIAYLLLFWLVLKKLFVARYGPALVILFAASSFPVSVNALGVDFIARGFTHVPFFLLLTLGLFGKRRWLYTASMFLASLVNGYLMLIAVLFLLMVIVWERNRDDVYRLAAAVAGLGVAALIITSEVVDKPFYFLFTEACYLNPSEILTHALPFLVLAGFYRHRRMTILLAAAVIVGSFIHYNPFFPVFMVYYAGAQLLGVGRERYRWSRWIAALMVTAMAASFGQFAFQKYDPHTGGYVPRYDHRLDKATAWVLENTRRQAVFLALMADGHDLALIALERPVYLGYAGHVSHLGLSWQPRANATIRAFTTGSAPPEVDYIFYGPVEKKYFPEATLPVDVVYEDEEVTICAAR